MSCSAKDKRSNVLDARSDYRVPYAKIDQNEPPSYVTDEFITKDMTVWEFDYSENGGDTPGGHEVIIPVEVPQEYRKKKEKTPKKLHSRSNLTPRWSNRR